MAVTQKQIANELGVSIALVSRVLSGKAAEIGIIQETIDRVIKTAEEMGYVPSAAALTLKGKSTRTIGVAVYDFNDPFFGALIKQIQAQAHTHNYSLVLAGFLNRKPNDQDLQPLHKHKINGLIILGSDTDAEWVNTFAHLPIARIGHGSEIEKSVRITINEEHAAQQIIEHLIATGHQKICSISSNLPALKKRQATLQKIAKIKDLQMTSLCTDDTADIDSFTAADTLIQQQLPDLATRCNALICATDKMAMGALHALYDARINIPREMAVIGFDDIPASKQFIPPITTIRQPLATMAKEAFNAIINKSAPRQISLPSQLIIRRSTTECT